MRRDLHFCVGTLDWRCVHGRCRRAAADRRNVHRPAAARGARLRREAGSDRCGPHRVPRDEALHLRARGTAVLRDCLLLVPLPVLAAGRGLRRVRHRGSGSSRTGADGCARGRTARAGRERRDRPRPAALDRRHGGHRRPRVPALLRARRDRWREHLDARDLRCAARPTRLRPGEGPPPAAARHGRAAGRRVVRVGEPDLEPRPAGSRGGRMGLGAQPGSLDLGRPGPGVRSWTC